MLTELILVRHGETDWNRDQRLQGWTDIPLNERGRDQARRLARRLEGRRFDALYTSDLSRAVETAEIVGAAVGMTPVRERDLRELNLGECEGLAGAAKDRWYREVVTGAGDDDPLGPGAESWRQLRARVVGAFDRLARDHADRSVLVVTHGGSVKALLSHFLDLPDPSRLSVWGNTSVSRVYFGKGQPQLTLLNDVSHLADALSPMEY